MPRRIPVGWIVFLIALSMTAACASDDDDDDSNDDDDTGDDDDDDDDDDDNDDDDGTFWSADFDDLAPGDLPEPWIVSAENGTAQVVVLDETDAGNGMEIADPSDAEGDGVSAIVDLQDLPEILEPFRLRYEMIRTEGNLAGFAAVSFNPLTRNYDAAFQVDFEGLALTTYSVDDGEFVTCAEIEHDTWYEVFVDVDPNFQRYSIYLDGHATPCNLYPYVITDRPVIGFAWVGYTDEGWYGTALVDNVAAWSLSR